MYVPCVKDEERNTVETQGYIFYRHFHSVLDRHFVRNFEDFAESILQRIGAKPLGAVHIFRSIYTSHVALCSDVLVVTNRLYLLH